MTWSIKISVLINQAVCLRVNISNTRSPKGSKVSRWENFSGKIHEKALVNKPPPFAWKLKVPVDKCIKDHLKKVIAHVIPVVHRSLYHHSTLRPDIISDKLDSTAGSFRPPGAAR